MGGVDEQIRLVNDKMTDAFRVRSMLEKKLKPERANVSESFKPERANRFNRESLLRQAKAEKSKARQLADSVNQSLRDENDVMHMLTDEQMSTLADLIAERMQPQQQPEERMYTQAEMDAMLSLIHI